MIERTNVAGLRLEDGWYEIGYATGDAVWPVARVRVEPLATDDDRRWPPNAAVAPARVTVRLSASLIDGKGQVLKVGGRLLLGPESIHSWSFDAGVPFDARAWLDGCAAAVVAPLLAWAGGMVQAGEHRLLPAAASGVAK